jgi:hypothetical protein
MRPRTVSAGMRRFPWITISVIKSCCPHPVEHNSIKTSRKGHRALQIFMIEEDEGDAPAGTGHAWPDLLFVTTGLS